MHATTVAIDLAKEVFELALRRPGGAHPGTQATESAGVPRVMENRAPIPGAQGHGVRLLPARDV